MGIGTLTTVGKNEALDALVSTNTTLYLALLDGAVEETGVGSGGTPYARQAITFAVAAAGSKANSITVAFDNGGAADWGSAIDEWGIYDALTGGNKIGEGLLDAVSDMSVPSAYISFSVGAIILALSD